jgi:hypothetical protein
MADWVVVVRNKRIRHLNAVVPVRMPLRQSATSRRVQQVGVDVVLQDLHNISVCIKHTSLMTYVARQHTNKRMLNHRPRVR